MGADRAERACENGWVEADVTTLAERETRYTCGCGESFDNYALLLNHVAFSQAAKVERLEAENAALRAKVARVEAELDPLPSDKPSVPDNPTRDALYEAAFKRGVAHTANRIRAALSSEPPAGTAGTEA